MEINSNLRVSTMTLISELTSDINLKKLFDNLSINDKIRYIEYGSENQKGEKKNKTARQKTIKKFFYNQITTHIFENKIVNVKIFNNGRIQMTGLKSKEQGINVINILLNEIKILESEIIKEIFSKEKLEIQNSKIVLINSDFDVGFKIKRETLQRIIISRGYYSSYEPTIYPGVNIKYYFNTAKQDNGICNCSEPCNGKGINGLCKKITVAVFNSGKIIITGGQSYEQLNTAYGFITDLIKENQEDLILK